jgi:hypothetical protein
MKKYVSEKIAPELLQRITTEVNDLNEQIKIMAVNIRKEKKAGVRTMAKGREGLVRLVAKVAIQHEKSLSREDYAVELSECLDYDSQLKSVRQAVIVLAEMIDKTIWGNSADAMKISDRFQKTLQDQRDNNTVLDSAMGEIDEWNKRFGVTATPPDEVEEPEIEAKDNV